MVRKALTLAMAVAVAVMVGVLGVMPTAAQQVGASRSFDLATVAPSGEVEVTVDVMGPVGFADVVETLPDGFSYVANSGKSDNTISVADDGQDVTFTFNGETSFTYEVTASSVEGRHGFDGKLTLLSDPDVRHTVGGANTVTVEAAVSPGVRASRSFDSAMVVPSGEVEVTVDVMGPVGFADVVETLPDGFSYVANSGRSDSTISVAHDGQDVTFTFNGETSFMYKATASSVEGRHGFDGKLTLLSDPDVRHTVGGASTVTVEAAVSPGVRASRSFDSATVVPSGEVEVTVDVMGPVGFADVVETLPDGFSYVANSGRSDSTISVAHDGQDVTFTFNGETSFMYKATASSVEGRHGFDGKLTLLSDPDVRHTVGGVSTITVGTEPPPSSGNAAPVFRGMSAVSVGENTTTVTAVRAEDRDSQDRVTGYDITGGADRAKFALTNTRVLSFKTAPDFEDPTDADTNNNYMVVVRATSGTGDRQRTATRTFTVTVTNQDEMGRVTFWRDGADATTAAIRVGDMLTGLAEDPDGNAGDMPPMADMYTQITGATWQWARSMTPTMMDSWMDIADATDAMYTVTDDDDGYYLQATAMYDDGEGADKMAYEMTASAVSTPPLDMCIEELTSLPMTVMDAWASGCMSEAKTGSYARYYTFTLAGDMQVEMNLTSGTDPYLALRRGEGRDGAMVASNDNVGSRNFNSSINMMLDAGTYTVEATTYFAGQTGDFTLSVRPLQETEVLGTLTGSVDRSNSRWTSDHMSTQQEGSYARSYTFTLAAATHLAINLTAPEDPYLFLLDSSGMVVHESDNITTRNLNSRIDETLQPGRYTIEATTYFPARTGTFHLSIGVIP